MRIPTCLLVVPLFLSTLASAAPPAPLGAPSFLPTPDQPVGWRGDGTGRYPGATPPLEWSIGKDLTGKNVAWVTQLPFHHGGSGASQPIVVGNRIYFTVGAQQATKGPLDLYCLNLTDGKILGIASLTPYDAATPEDKKKAADTVEPMLAELRKLNGQLIETLNAKKLKQDDWRGNVNGKRQDLGAKITDAMIAVDSKYKMGVDRHDWGYASATPCSDGTNIYVWFANHTAACFTLDGKPVWATMESKPLKGMAEHGCHSSPVLLPDRMVTMYGQTMQAYDKKTGKMLWAQEVEGCWGLSYSSPNAIRLQDGYAILAPHGQGLRGDTGALLWGKFPDYKGENTTPVVEGHALVGFETSGIYALPLPNSLTAGGKLKASAQVKFPREGGSYQVASPLVYDGLVYCVNEKALLRVFNPAGGAGNGSIVYEQQLDLKGEHGWVGAPGLSPSPAIGGKNLYVMDNQGSVAVVQPGRTFKQLAKNDNAVKDALVTTPVFSGKHALLRGQAYIYCLAAP